MEESGMEGMLDAVMTGNVQFLSQQLPCKPKLINKPIDDENTTLLHLAANSSPQALRLLLQHGAEVNHQNDDGLTALHVAAMWGKKEAVAILLDCGADPGMADEEELLPLDHARSEGHGDCVQLLEEACPDASLCANEMSMAEVYVSMFTSDDELTQVTQQPLEELTTRLSASLNVSTPSYHTDASLVAHSPLDEASYHTVAHSPLDEARTTGAQRSPTPPTVRRKLFGTDENHGGARLNTSDLADLSATILLEEYKENISVQGRLDSDASPVLRDSSSSSAVSTNKSLIIPNEVLQLSDEGLRKKLLSLGEKPGPIFDSTRLAYQSYLSKILSGIHPPGNSGYKAYKYELALVLNGTLPLKDCSNLEVQACSGLSTPMAASSRPNSKDHFNYLLLKSTALDKLQDKTEGLAGFRVFVEAVFYVGKGKKNRTLQHLKDARDVKQKTGPVSEKLKTILGLWNGGRGVVSLEIFHYTTAQEAFTREACIIDAIGLDMLTNVQRGHVYGCVCGWRMCKRRQLGVHLLYKAFRSFLIHTPQELLEQDI